MENIFTLIGMTLILVLIPGPNVALIVANSIKYGTKFGLMTVLGTTVGVGMQLLIVVLGLSTILLIAGNVLGLIKWAGVIYLVYIGFKMIKEPASDLSSVQTTENYKRKTFLQGLGLALINPKTLIFNAAFIPQFLSVGKTDPLHVLLISGIYLFVLGVGDIVWAVSSGYAGRYIRGVSKFANKVCGSFMIFAGLGLALTNDDSTN